MQFTGWAGLSQRGQSDAASFWQITQIIVMGWPVSLEMIFILIGQMQKGWFGTFAHKIYYIYKIVKVWNS